MKLILNNRDITFGTDTLTMADLMEIKKFTFKKIIVKVNKKFIEPEDYHKTFLKENDNVVVLHLLAGG